MAIPQYADVSGYQGNINWPAYAKWAKSFDGVGRVAIKATEGVGFTDHDYAAYRHGALAAGVDRIIYYHYGRPGLGNSAYAEANWLHSVVGNIRANDLLMLDYEEQSPQANAEWVYEWLDRQGQNYAKHPIIYASDGYVRSRLQDSRLAKFPLVLANWQFTPTERPPCPYPWTHYNYLQFTDRATNVPGISGKVDCNVFLGVDMSTNPGADPAFQATYWNSTAAQLGGTPADFTTGIAAQWKRDVANDLWRGAPTMREGRIVWKGATVPFQRFEGGFYTWESGTAFWHSNS